MAKKLKSKKGEPFTNPNRKKFLGLDKQDWIKYFFSGNASLAIFILILICVFLLREAGGFFPEHHDGLKLYRRSGVETYTMVDHGFQKYKALATHLSVAYGAEYNEAGKEIQKKLEAYNSTHTYIAHRLQREEISMKDAKSKFKEYEESKPELAARYAKIIEQLTARINEGRERELSKLEKFTLGRFFGKWEVPALKKIDPETRSKIFAAVRAKDPKSREEPEYIQKLEEEKSDLDNAAWEKHKYLNDFYLKLTGENAKDWSKLWREFQIYTTDNKSHALSVVSLPKRIEAQITVGLTNERLYRSAGPKTNPDDVAEWNATRADKYGRGVEELARATYFHPLARILYLHRLNGALEDAGTGLVDIEAEDRKTVEDWFAAANTDLPDFWDALENGTSLGPVLDKIPSDATLKGESITMTDGQKASLLALHQIKIDSKKGYENVLEGLSKEVETFVLDYPFDEKINWVYDRVPVHGKILEEVKAGMAEVLDQLPASLETKTGNEELAKFRKRYDKVVAEMDSTQEGLEEWRHDKTYSFGASLIEFFFGIKWTNNSSIQDRYGLLPLFTGSMIISIIAIVVAVPFAISAAIYVNQLASHRMQTILKPAIEFIEAIPSIVLGFFGIVVLSQFLWESSEVPWLAWLPGFPIESRLNMLAAGLLLAFMAVPTIFTLAEDALNNVPDHFRQASLALGATRLLTAVRVMIPAAMSGIIAAVLLGFGRVIGETMVVLLVAGNRISMPNFSENGIGVITEPSHTMTGMIAQGLGEAVVSSTTWRALFMVGFVLFMISLVVNFLAQRIMSSFAKHS